MEDFEMRLTSIALILSVSLTAGCGNDEDDGGEGGSGSADAVPTGAFLKPSDFEASNVKEIPKSEAESEVRSTFFFQNQEMPERSSSGLESFTKDCGTVADDLKAEGGSLTISYVNDSSRCDDGSDVTTTVRSFASFSCSDTDMGAAVTGKNGVDLVRRDRWRFCPEDQDQRVLFNLELLMKGQRNGASYEARVIGAWMGLGGGPCAYTVEDGRVSVTECTYRIQAKTVLVNGADVKTETYGRSVFDMEGLAGPANGYYYDEGKVAIRVNDWSGHMMYSADSNPRYSITNGSETAEGTFSGAFSLTDAAGMLERMAHDVAGEL